MRLSGVLLLAISAAASVDKRQDGARPPNALSYDSTPPAPQNAPLPPSQNQLPPQIPPYPDHAVFSQQQAAVANAPPINAPPVNPPQLPPPANPALADVGPLNQPQANAPPADVPLPNGPGTAALPASPDGQLVGTVPQDATAPVYLPQAVAPVENLPVSELALPDSRPAHASARPGDAKTGGGVVPTVTPQPGFEPATHDRYCSGVLDLFVAANARPQASLYCSSKLNLKARPTITTTISTTIPTTVVSTYTTSTEVVTRLAREIPNDVSLEAVVVTKTVRELTTKRVSSTVFPTKYYSCLSGTTGRSLLEAQGQAANTRVPKPDVFTQFPSDGDIISACRCLGLSTEPTATVTSKISSISTFYSTEHEIATSTSFVLPPGTSFSIRVPPTSTRVINSRSTVTHTHALATNTAFALLGSNSRYARVDDTDMLHFSDNYTGPYSRVPTIFRLDTRTCALSVVDGVHFGAESFIATEATNPGQSLFGDTVRFEHPNSVGAGFSALLCHVEQSSQRLRCAIDGDVPHSGTVQDSDYWQLGPRAQENFAIKAIPVNHGRTCFARCRQQDDLLFLDGDQFVGQTVLQNCLARCKEG